MIYFTSDLHLFHNKPFIYEPRGFRTVEEMNEAIVKNWNKTVAVGDDVYCLGDLMLNDNEGGVDLIKQLHGNIHIIRGNHDSEDRMKLYNECHNVVEVCEGKFFKYNKYHFYLSHYPTLCDNYDDGIHLKRKMINLCGHRHAKDRFFDMDKGVIYHVELDAHNCAPVSIEEIITDMRSYLNEKV